MPMWYSALHIEIDNRGTKYYFTTSNLATGTVVVEKKRRLLNYYCFIYTVGLISIGPKS